MDITISLSKKNAHLLFKHIFIGNWILTANKSDKDKELENFYSSMLSVMKNYNIINEIEFDEELNDYFLFPEKEEEYIENIDDYCDDYFWEELAHILSIRDISEEMTTKQFDKLNDREKIELITKKEDHYFNEFNKNGIKHLKIE